MAGQAAAADLFLRSKVRALALASRGRLPLTPRAGDGPAAAGAAPAAGGAWAWGGAEYPLWEEARREAGARRVRWAGVKGVERGVEKALRAYACDVARLLDCCRQVWGGRGMGVGGMGGDGRRAGGGRGGGGMSGR